MMIPGWHSVVEVRRTINTKFEIIEEIAFAEVVISHHFILSKKNKPVVFKSNLANKSMFLMFMNFQMLSFRLSVSTTY